MDPLQRLQAAVADPADHLLVTQRQLATVQAAIDLEPYDVDPLVAGRVLEPGDGGDETLAGAVKVQSFHGPNVERVTAYRFQRRGILNEHLFHAWPAEGYDFPALTTVVFETAGGVILGADLIPIADVAFDREYYGRWYAEHTDLVKEWWPTVSRHLVQSPPTPDPYFTNQLGSRLAVLANLTPEGLDDAVGYVEALTDLWVTLWQRAEPSPEKQRARTEERRIQLMKRAYKGLDYHSPASVSLASVLGYRGANLMFDNVFGPDIDPQPMDSRRTYLEVAISPGTPSRSTVPNGR